MNQKLIQFCIFIILTSCNTFQITRNDIKELKYESNRQNDENERRKHEFELLRNPMTNTIPENSYELEMSWAKSHPPRKQKVGNTYSNLGPSNLGGRTRAIAFDVRDEDIILAGGVSSGVFRSTHGGSTWTKVSSYSQIHNVTSIVQDPRSGYQDIWYYSTGEASGNSASAGSSALYMGNGVYKSTNNGLSWTRLTNSNNSSLESFNDRADFIQRLVVDPTNGDVYMACIGTIYRSDDGGDTWTSVLAGSFNNNAQLTDIIVTPLGRLYAAFAGTNSNSVEGVWTSIDGTNWTRIANSSSVTNWKTQGNYGRVVLAFAPSDTTKLYALYDNDNNSNCSGSPAIEADLFVATNSGGTHSWNNLSSNLPDESGCSNGNDPFAVQGGYDLCVAIKPDNASVVFVGGTSLFRSTDGFTSTSNTTRIGGYANATSYSKYSNHHPDIHILAFDGVNDDIIFSGTDGGIHKADITASYVSWTSLNNNYITYQYYHVAISPDTYKNYYIGGTQDNGTARSIGSSEQEEVWSGDGCAVGIAHKSGTYTEFVSFQNGYVYRRLNTLSPYYYNDQLTPPSSTSNKSRFVTYFHLDPDNPDLLYYANGNELYRQTSATTASTNTGWTSMTGANTSIGSADIMTMATSRGSYNSSTSSLFIGTNNGKIFRLDDPKNAIASTSVTDITPSGISSGSVISDISVNPRNDDTLILVCSNYGVISIWQTENANASTPTWINMEGSGTFTPSARSCEIIIKNNVVEYYVGTSVGLYSTTTASTSTSWSQEGSSTIGYAVVTSLDHRPSDNALLIGTHGNGMFLANIGGEIEPDVETSTTSSTMLLGANEKVRFYSSNNKVIAEVENLSSHNYGSTTVAIDNAGTGTMNFSTNTATAKKIMDKTILITPTTNNTSGAVKITTFYSNTEASNWASATGNSINSLNQIKSSSAISSGTLANTIYGSSPSVNTTYKDNNVSIAATYSNGFSGVGAGLDGSSGPLPVDLISFNGEFKENKVELNWLTAQELNSSKFIIERYNGKIFDPIGFVNAAGNSSEIQRYTFSDFNFEDATTINLLYRLKMVDIDNSYKYSSVLSVSKTSDNQVNISPNPANKQLNIHLPVSLDGAVSYQLTDLFGNVMLNGEITERRNSVDIRSLKNGIYFVTILQDRNVVSSMKLLVNN